MTMPSDVQVLGSTLRENQTRAVLFDVDGTLYHQLPLRACMAGELARFAAHPGRTRAALRTARMLRAYRLAHESLRADGVCDPSLALLQTTQAASRSGCSINEVDGAVMEWMRRRPLKYLPWCRRSGLAATLTDLRRRGMRLGVLSDYPARDKLAALGIADLFSLVLCTSDPEIGAFKPDPRGFWRACELWNLSPDEVLYVGDRPDVDGHGALAAGLRSVIVSGAGRRGRLAADARTIGIRRLGDIGSIALT